MFPRRNVRAVETVTDETGNNRLVLRFVQVDFPSNAEGFAEDFYSLDWEFKVCAKWISRAVISCADFQKGSQRRRWVIGVQSLDAGAGRAILHIGQDGVPDATGTMYVTYSWHEWDLLNNQDVGLIRVCDDPFQPLEAGNGGF
jgi:hypothetical protein